MDPAHPPSDQLDQDLLGLVEDDRFRAVVTTAETSVVVDLEGRLDDSVVPALDDLLAAVERWDDLRVRRSRRGSGRRGERPTPPPPVEATALVVDTSGLVAIGDAGNALLRDRCARWRRRHGPSTTTVARRAHGSIR